MSTTSEKEIATVSFASPKEFEAWMKQNHSKVRGLWVQLYKKDSGEKTITYAEALDVALCYGWIDSQKKSNDEKSYLQKFTPRRTNSLWSKVNRKHVERLIQEKRMQPSGVAEVEAAQKDGRWEKAYDSSRTTEMPEDLLARLKKDKKAHAFFKTLTKANIYAITWRLQTAKKPETREKRMETILEMLRNGQTFH